ncbi:RNA polymerase sigma-70 factor [Pedobacter chinensis]|uniref:RNA polymerase sigma-70 factor n=1 Tax=Pedobacter chinensis TaxID=2282421 RepID=A0A369Q0T8_9SPHI|nr:RNA polymerase sigma-70 factor [Pedobacter chinensis]RDC56539.1 RNA polymerase sigma-70 factor [Pedobacter chinensis]
MQLYKDDTQAATALHAGEMRALEYFYNSYKPLLFGFLLPYCKECALADELIQDTFLRFWDSRKKIDPDRNVKNLLFTIAKNLALDQLKRIRLEQHHAEEAGLEILRDNSTMEGVIYSDYQRCLVEVINKMPERHRQVFSLSRNHHLSNAEISTELSISVKTVEKHMTGTLKAIRSFLKQHDILIFLMALLGITLQF